MKIPKNVYALGFVSLFNDISSEMIYPIVPIFLTTVLGAPVELVGVIEGIAESTASVIKLWSGWASDKMTRRKPFVVAGYSFSTVSKVILGFAPVWPLVLLGRFVDKVGKGIRTAPRDALISESSIASERGKAFGFHRTMDSLGAVLGPLLALLLLQKWQNHLNWIFLAAAIPSAVGVVLLTFVREIKNPGTKTARPKITWKDVPREFKIFLAISVIFAIGNSSDTFLILRSQSLGLSTSASILAYTLYNFTYAFGSTPAGILSDKLGAQKLLPLGFLIFAGVYTSFGFITNPLWIWALFPIYGLYMALTDGVGKAYMSKMVPAEKLGSLFGIYQMAMSACILISSSLAGVLWTNINPSAPFFLGGATALISTVGFYFIPRK